MPSRHSPQTNYVGHHLSVNQLFPLQLPPLFTPYFHLPLPFTCNFPFHTIRFIFTSLHLLLPFLYPSLYLSVHLSTLILSTGNGHLLQWASYTWLIPISISHTRRTVTYLLCNLMLDARRGECGVIAVGTEAVTTIRFQFN